jgi:pyruvate formate lyase activating enzyme
MGRITKIQRFSISDGPGIRTTVFFKGCSLRCQWCANPETQTVSAEIVYHAERCVANCGACVEVCTPGALRLDGRRVILVRDVCNRCFRCVSVCPTNALLVVGQEVSVEQILETVARDDAFYRASGGGITLSGGEPLAQPAFALELLAASRQRGWHTVVDTAGDVEWAALREILQYTDLLLYDIKHVDDIRHHAGTGARNTRSLQTAERLAALGWPLVVRVPLIPGFNADQESLEGIAAFVAKLRSVHYVEIVPYHRLGQPKYASLGRSDEMWSEAPLDAVRLDAAAQVLASARLPIRMA